MRGLRFGALAAALLLSTAASLLAREDPATVLRVIDGDTIEVSIVGTAEKIRLIGVDTPETVHPNRPVEAFGKEASQFTRKLTEGKKVVLRDELGGQDRDKYGRLLRYVYMEDGTFVNAEIIKQGYGHAYVAFPFSHMEEFRGYERQARENGLGLWGSTDIKAEPGQARAPTEGQVVGSSKSNKYHRRACIWAQKISSTNLVTFKGPDEAQGRGYVSCKVCNPSTGPTGTEAAQASVVAPPAAAASQQEEIVYVTRTGTKYHRAGCRYLKSVIPIPLKQAAARYSPCSVCRPPVLKAER